MANIYKWVGDKVNFALTKVAANSQVFALTGTYSGSNVFDSSSNLITNGHFTAYYGNTATNKTCSYTVAYAYNGGDALTISGIGAMFDSFKASFVNDYSFGTSYTIHSYTYSTALTISCSDNIFNDVGTLSVTVTPNSSSRSGSKPGISLTTNKTVVIPNGSAVTANTSYKLTIASNYGNTSNATSTQVTITAELSSGNYSSNPSNNANIIAKQQLRATKTITVKHAIKSIAFTSTGTKYVKEGASIPNSYTIIACTSYSNTYSTLIIASSGNSTNFPVSQSGNSLTIQGKSGCAGKSATITITGNAGTVATTQKTATFTVKGILADRTLTLTGNTTNTTLSGSWPETWTSDKTSVATVSQNQSSKVLTITSISPGTAVLKGASGEKITVTVTSNALAAKTINTGDTITITFNGGSTPSITSGETSITKVSAAAKTITIKGATAGSGTITCGAETCTVTVENLTLAVS